MATGFIYLSVSIDADNGFVSLGDNPELMLNRFPATNMCKLGLSELIRKAV